MVSTENVAFEQLRCNLQRVLKVHTYAMVKLPDGAVRSIIKLAREYDSSPKRVL